MVTLSNIFTIFVYEKNPWNIERIIHILADFYRSQNNFDEFFFFFFWERLLDRNQHVKLTRRTTISYIQ